MRAIVLAYSDIGCTGIEALLEHGFDIAGVLTHADDPRETAWFRSVAELAARHGLPVFAPPDPSHPLWVRKIRELAPDGRCMARCCPRIAAVRPRTGRS
jgi:UDP-4-amino-4-deoxy-L-arabinose formyltransferase/UDP-glucuronic acid dehydrogenase (UDP-4-keto-hexauronic acid decarboxylating)